MQPELGAVARARDGQADEQCGREQAVSVQLRKTLFHLPEARPPPGRLDDGARDGAVALPTELEISSAPRGRNPAERRPVEGREHAALRGAAPWRLRTLRD